MSVDARTQAQKLGAWGEQLAARHLIGEGMVLLDRNWRGESGELDLVLREGNTLVVCEVKTRSSTGWGQPLEAVGRQKAGRLRRLAGQWMAAHAVRAPDVRIDLVGVLRTPNGPVIEHVRAVGA
ncbi:YraN family protein [Nocardioides sp.]|uniref:YraN family protein n=1 Tax=Nocardioides sp. TaxID=35761 RepID=UPI002C894E48|nr:YraN family protein [Nocardioides sp.]HSX67536.1 YraN family protein [Nocardioides sp.]